MSKNVTACAVKTDELYVKLESAVGKLAAHSFYNRYNGDIEFIRGMSEEDIKSQSSQISHDRGHTTPLNHLKVTIQKRIERLKKSIGKSSNRAFVETQLKRQQEMLNGVDEVIGIANVVDYTYDEAFGSEDVEGWVKKMDRLLTKTNEDIDRLDTLSKKEQRELINKITENLQAYYDYGTNLGEVAAYDYLYAKSVEDGVKPAEGTTLWKINQLLTAKDKIHANYKKAIYPVIAKLEYGMTNLDANKAVEKEYDQVRVKLMARKVNGENVDAELEKNFKWFKDNYVTEELLLERLKVIDKDVPFLDKMLTPMISLGDYTLSLFDRFLKKDFFEARLSYDVWKKDVAKAYKSFVGGKSRDNVAKLNEGITEVIVEYKWDEEKGEWYEKRSNAFVQAIDYSSYNLDLRDTIEQSKSLVKGSKEYDKLWAKFFTENTERVSYENYTEYGREVDGIKVSVAKVREKFSKNLIGVDEYVDWVMSNMALSKKVRKRFMVLGVDDEYVLDKKKYADEIMRVYDEDWEQVIYKGSLNQPRAKKYMNMKYYKLSGEEKAYHDRMVTEYFKSQSRLPESIQERMGYKLPYMYKSKRDLLMEGRVGKAVKTAKEESFAIRTDDTEFGDLEVDKSAPIYYTSYIPAEDSSLDVFESIVEFEKMSMMYEVVGKIEPISNAMKVLINDREVLEAGKLSKIAKDIGVEEFIKKKGKSNASEMLDWLIEQKLYGELNLKEMIDLPGGMKINAGKTISSVMSAASLTMLGGPEFLKSVANTIQAKVQRTIEAVSGEYFDFKDLAYGEKEFVKHSKNILSDFSQPYSVSLEGQWLDMVDFMQGNFKDEHGNNISGSAFKKLATSGSWMFANNFSEYQTQVSMAFSLANTVKLKIGEKIVNLKDAYELGVDGVIKLRDGVTKEDGSPWTNDDLFDFMGKLHGLNKRIDGVYNTFDRSLVKRWSLGRLLVMFKGFLAPTVKKRFKSKGNDQELGGVTEGFYITFYKTLIKDYKDLGRFLLRKENNLTDMQKHNVKRALSEYAMLFLLTTVAISMKNLADDDDELKKSWGYQSALYEVTRASSELMFYQPVLGLKDQLRIFQSPSAISGFIDRATRAGVQTVGYGEDGWMFNDEYKRAEGWNKKGDSKLTARYLALLGFNGNNMTPSQATEVFNK